MFKIICYFVIFTALIDHCFSVLPKAWEPDHRTDQWWIMRHEKLLEKTKTYGKDIQVLFYGDYITEGWDYEGKVYWDQYYAHHHAYNYGIAGDRTQEILWRLDNGEVNGLNPKLVVLMIGTNNMGLDNTTDISHGIKAVIDKINQKLPHTKILLLGILPRGDYDVFQAEIRTVNSIISKYANGHTIEFLDMSSRFNYQSGGKYHLYYGNYAKYEYVHLSTNGYKEWALYMNNLFLKMIN